MSTLLVNLQIINCTEVPPVEFQKPLGEMRVGCEAQPSSETFKIVICSGDCDLCWDAREPTAPFPLTSSWWADAPASEWPTEVMRGVSKNTPGICGAVLFCQWTDAGFHSEILQAGRSLAVEILSYKWSKRDPCSALQGEQGGTEGAREEKPEHREGGRWLNVKTTLRVLFLFVFKAWGCGYVGDKWEDRRRGGKTSGAQYVLSSAPPAHLQWGAHTGFPESLVAAAASLSCGSWSNKGGVWIIPCCAISQSGEVCPEAQSISSLVTAVSSQSVWEISYSTEKRRFAGRTTLTPLPTGNVVQTQSPGQLKWIFFVIWSFQWSYFCSFLRLHSPRHFSSSVEQERSACNKPLVSQINLTLE